MPYVAPPRSSREERGECLHGSMLGAPSWQPHFCYMPGMEKRGTRGASRGPGEQWGHDSSLTLHDQPGPPHGSARGVASHAQVAARVCQGGSEEVQLPAGEHLEPRPCGTGRDGEEEMREQLEQSSDGVL